MPEPWQLALIPARGGSKRLPGKNVVPWFGHPLLAYTVAAARNSGLFQRVIVSTDDARVGAIAQWYGAEYLPRPAALATDDATLVDVAVHALHSISGPAPEAICQLMPNCPLRRGDDIRRHWELFAKRSFQISVVPYRAVYPHWAMTMDGDGQGKFLFGPEYLVASQRLAKAYCPTGAIWWARTKEFLEQRAFYGEPLHLAPMDADRGTDIDSQEDLELASVLAAGLKQVQGKDALEPIGREPFREGRGS